MRVEGEKRKTKIGDKRRNGGGGLDKSRGSSFITE
jgi:hypothetical protein